MAPKSPVDRARLSLAVAAGKLAATGVRRAGRGGGTTLPGRISRGIDGRTLEKLSRLLPEGAALVSGTNGKTTTSSLLRTILAASGRRVMANQAGANLLSGVTSAAVADSRLGGRPRADIAVLEVDEASLPSVAEAVGPRLVLVTNLFRDQLDRYGELEASAAAIGSALAALPAASTALLCADDPGVAALASGLRADVRQYGIDADGVGETALPHAADAKFCPRCGSPFDFSRVYVGHLGIYRCPRGDFTRPALDIRATEVDFQGLTGQSVTAVGMGLDGVRLDIPLSGLYNTYNILAAAGSARLLGVDAATIAAAVREFQPAFGRLEQVEVDGRRLRLMLAKNPASFNEVLRASRVLGGGRRFVVGVNDRIADGRDISWIWDVDFELLAGSDSVVLCGTRALDMAVRLKYAGVDSSSVTVAEDPAAALDAALSAAAPGDEVYLLPTYTAMLDLRAELARRGHLRAYWDDRR